MGTKPQAICFTRSRRLDILEILSYCLLRWLRLHGHLDTRPKRNEESRKLSIHLQMRRQELRNSTDTALTSWRRLKKMSRTITLLGMYHIAESKMPGSWRRL